MPRDSNGIYTLPDGYQAVTGEVILPSQHNPPLEDIGQALTLSVPRNGAAPMTAALKLADGTASAPALAFNSALGSGLYLLGSGAIGVAVNGALVAQFAAGGLLGLAPIGSGKDFYGTTAPAGWIFPYGQAISRTTYAALFAVLGTTFGAGDGSTTFNVPDKRGRASFGKDDMGGTSANRITNQAGGWNGDTLGASGGSETHVLTIPQLPAHNHGGTTGSTSGLVDKVPTFSIYEVGDGPPATNRTLCDGTSNGDLDHVHTIPSQGAGDAHNNLPPGISCNYIIFTGVV